MSFKTNHENMTKIIEKKIAKEKFLIILGVYNMSLNILQNRHIYETKIRGYLWSEQQCKSSQFDEYLYNVLQNN